MTAKNKIHLAINTIHRVIAEIGIEKKGEFQGKYANSPHFNYQKIDDIYDLISPLMAKENIICIPYVIDQNEVVDQTSTGRLIRTKVTVEYTFTHVEDGSFIKVRTIGEELDTGAKSTIKAMTAAHKTALKQMFLIPNKGSDQNANENAQKQSHSNNINSQKPVAPQPPIKTVHSEVGKSTKLLSQGQASWLSEQLALVGADIGQILSHYNIDNLSQLPLNIYEPIRKRVIELKNARNPAQ